MNDILSQPVFMLEVSTFHGVDISIHKTQAGAAWAGAQAILLLNRKHKIPCGELVEALIEERKTGEAIDEWNLLYANSGWHIKIIPVVVQE